VGVSAWDVAMVWVVWNVVMPFLGFLVLLALFGWFIWFTEVRPSERERAISKTVKRWCR